MKNVLTPARGAVAAALALGAALSAEAQSEFRRTLDAGEQATRRAEQLQEQINQLDDERSDLVSEIRTILQRKDAAELFALQQERVVASQEEEIASLTDQLGRVDEITAQMIPMMLDMIEDLETFIAADLPFKSELRRTRLENLRSALDDPQIPPPEAYRLIIEAYQAEMQYGNTIDTWKEDVVIDGNSIKVDMFQYGRAALVYVTPDRRAAARYDRVARKWQPLPSSYIDDVVLAIDVAEQREQQVVLSAPVQKFTPVE